MVNLPVFRKLQSRRQAYLSAFAGATGDTVLRDLAKFCRAHESTFHPDARIAAVLEGRREVWLRIQEHLQLTDEELYALKGGPTDAG
ncbi:Bbp19 family protein [Pannonibacter tanglangensis]|uniref:Bbp19-like phage domain-containing protein n=1 Tax=Pannonibacter tanglangensis TaxID=2750084 RepID=A0ABW9ZC19_9HYPH|nr:hypothetical protein [Pannonibacter sp. XCT-34]NBN62056.1 hypothetical protein [Pannonibacter sp. XCT-34]